MGRDRGLVHVGHDRRPEGRRHAPPRRLPERGLQCGDLDHAALSALPVDAADVPLQRLVLPVDRRDARRHPCLPAQGRRAVDPRGDARAPCRSLLRRTDRAQPADRRAGGAARWHRAERARHGRRRRAAGLDDRGHGADRDRHHACLRPDRGLWTGGRCRQAADLGRPGPLRADPSERATGRALPAAGRHDGDGPRVDARKCRPTARRWARSCSAATS